MLSKNSTNVYTWYDLTFCRLLGGSLGLQRKSFPRAWTDGENSYITGLVHVREEPGDGHVADCLLEEHLLYGGRAHRAECWEEQEQLPEATGLSWVPERHHQKRGGGGVNNSLFLRFYVQTV